MRRVSATPLVKIMLPSGRMTRPIARASSTALVLVVLATVPLDAIVHDLAFRHVVSHEVRLAANGVTQAGTAWASVGILGALAVAGHRAGDRVLLASGVGGLAGVALGNVAGHVVKQVACRARPGLLDGWGVGARGPIGGGATERAAAWSFFHWPCLTDSRHQSFPSGHAVTAFAMAAALTAAVPARRRLWLAVAAAVAASRIVLNAHFLTDVVGGALLGWWTGRGGLVLGDLVIARVFHAAAMAAPVGSPPTAGVSSG